MDLSNQSSPQQTPTTTMGTANPAVASSSTPEPTDCPYTELESSGDELFKQTTTHIGGWIPKSDLNRPDGF
ncbi:hypothetical protein PENCOP_c017G08133 [Penicillium coprophilum]|uniref:Uncharacterized protein n=1 Tax=Penicillium coprophilum TaxID=36646 RepID=A0A1V6U832_9EURO|nr:hypothetical protein PENCOP_c017G08133 [Penicillium coprophilum]